MGETIIAVVSLVVRLSDLDINKNLTGSVNTRRLSTLGNLTVSTSITQIVASSRGPRKMKGKC